MSRVKEWNNIRARLKKEFFEKGITYCEIMLPGCMKNNFLSFAHRHKRRWYYDKPELLGDFKQVVLSCVKCHNKIEYDKELTQQIFNKLRGPEGGDNYGKQKQTI